MPLLIDGYNLLHVSRHCRAGAWGRAACKRSRLALLNFLAESLDPAELPHTTVVFDAHDAPRGLPRVVEHRGITVRFAAQYETADDLIEELIRADSAPRRLVVVSSDHRIQRAARRRRAKAVDSDVWYAELVRARRRAPRGVAPTRRPGRRCRCWRRTSTTGSGSSAASRRSTEFLIARKRRPPARPRGTLSAESARRLTSPPRRSPADWTIPSRPAMARICWGSFSSVYGKWYNRPIHTLRPLNRWCFATTAYEISDDVPFSAPLFCPGEDLMLRMPLASAFRLCYRS